MKKYLCIFLISASVSYILPVQGSTELSSNQPQIVDTLKQDSIDPVCKMKVKAGSTKTAVYNKVVFGFCSDGCKKNFLKNPAKYLKK